MAVVSLAAYGALGGCGRMNSPRPVPGAGATTYYVNAAHGRDAARGTSPTTAWRTLDRVGQAHFLGGDTVLLRGGQRFEGTIQLTPSTLESTSRTETLTIGSYGRGRARIAPGPKEDGIRALNVAGVRVSGVDVVGRGNRTRNENASHTCRGSGWTSAASGQGESASAGIRFVAGGVDGTLDQGITVDHVDVSGFCDGIVVASNDDAPISHVRVRAVSTHDNGDAGVWTYDGAEAQHTIGDVVISGTRAYRNHRRGGIVLFGVDDGTVENSVAFANGRGAGGGFGIWAFDSNRILFAHDESYGNGSAKMDNDGGGFDFDRGVSNSVMAHNYSHGNGGAGFLVCSCRRWGRFYRMHNITIRSNVSRNDGSSGQPSLYVVGGELMTGIDIVSNRVESGTGSGPLVRVSADHRHYSDVLVRRNTFVTTGGRPLMEVDGPRLGADLVFRRNIWRAVGGRFQIQWGDRSFATRRAWRAAAAE